MLKSICKLVMKVVLMLRLAEARRVVGYETAAISRSQQALDVALKEVHRLEGALYWQRFGRVRDGAIGDCGGGQRLARRAWLYQDPPRIVRRTRAA